MDENKTTLVTENPPQNSPSSIPSQSNKSFLQKLLQEVREWIISLLFALIVVALLHTFLFTLIRVDGVSMYPTLNNGERLFVTVFDVKFGTIERNDVVICHYPNRGRTQFVKRVVGVPGDQVSRENGVTYIQYSYLDENGVETEVKEPLDINAMIVSTGLNDYEPYTLAENEYFLVGDNRYNSHDSRDWNDSDPSRDVGPITRDMIVGHVRQVIWPLNSFRSIT